MNDKINYKKVLFDFLSKYKDNISSKNDLEIEDNIYINCAKMFLTESRYNHSLSVAKLSYDVVKKHPEIKLNSYSVFIAGILHDLTKDISKEEQLLLAKENKYYKEDLPRYSFHAFSSAVLASKLFDIDSDIYDAISFHCTGKAKMNTFEKLIYTADKCEPTRDFDTVKERELLYQNIDEAFILILKEQEEYLAKNNVVAKNSCEYTFSMYNYYIQ